MNIVLIDYGIGNVRSIVSAFEDQGIRIILTSEKNDILSADGVVLPGVGAFSHGMESLKKANLIRTIKEYIKTKKPFMGICLGMQMLFESSTEYGETKGLGLISGKVDKLPDDHGIKIPHVGWGEINIKKIKWDGTILDGIKKDSDLYFVHSYVAKPQNKNEILSVTEHFGYEFCSSIKKDNVYGCQFHPEKSSTTGLKIIKNFIRICEK